VHGPPSSDIEVSEVFDIKMFFVLHLLRPNTAECVQKVGVELLKDEKPTYGAIVFSLSIPLLLRPEA